VCVNRNVCNLSLNFNSFFSEVCIFLFPVFCHKDSAIRLSPGGTVFPPYDNLCVSQLHVNMKTSSQCPVIATHSWRHQSASCVQLLLCTITLENIVPAFQTSRTLWTKKVSSCYGCSGLCGSDCYANYAFLGFHTLLIKIWSDFSGDSELPLSRYKAHHVLPPPPTFVEAIGHIPLHLRCITDVLLQAPSFSLHLIWIVTLKKEAVRSYKI